MYKRLIPNNTILTKCHVFRDIFFWYICFNSIPKNMRLLFCLFVSVFSFFATAQQTLSLEKIMAGDAFVGNQPSNPRFAIDGTTILFDWNPNNEIGASTYTWNTNAKAPKIAPIIPGISNFLNNLVSIFPIFQ